MNLFGKKSKPILVDQGLLKKYMKIKFPDPIITPISLPREPSELEKLLTKIFYNILAFIYHYFFIILILVGVGIYLYRRYTWYQNIKKIKDTKKEKESSEIKNYFDDIFNEEQNNSKQVQSSLTPINLKPVINNKLDKIKDSPIRNMFTDRLLSKNDIKFNLVQQPIKHQMMNTSTQEKGMLREDITKFITQKGNNNINSFNTIQQSKIGIPTKIVRFEEKTFDNDIKLSSQIMPKHQGLLQSNNIVAFNDGELNYTPY